MSRITWKALTREAACKNPVVIDAREKAAFDAAFKNAKPGDVMLFTFAGQECFSIAQGPRERLLEADAESLMEYEAERAKP